MMDLGFMATDYHLLPSPDPTVPVLDESDPTVQPSPDPTIQVPDALVWEILIWLPVKSLMRFKCVSKLWMSMIMDPSFAKAFQGGFRGLLVSEPELPRLSPTRNFFYIGLNLFDDHEGGDDNNNSGLLTHHHIVNHRSRRLGSTEAVNGLVCFYYGNYSCLYNIATRESMDLPLSQFEGESCTYHLGFDPVNNLYKLLKICAIYEFEYDHNHIEEGNLVSNLYCEILTLGVDASWRTLDPAPWEIVTRSVCYNGVLYWVEASVKHLAAADDLLIAFYLAQEKFEFVSGPQGDFWCAASRFGPGLALFGVKHMGATNREEAGMFVYDNNGGGQWSEKHKFDLPVEDARPRWSREIYPIGILPNGQVLITNDRISCPDSFYLYNKMQKKFTTIVIRDSPSSLLQRTVVSSRVYQRHISGYMTYHEENIIPLNCFTAPSPS